MCSCNIVESVKLLCCYCSHNCIVYITGMLQKLGSVVFALSSSAASFLAYNSTKDATMPLWQDIMVKTMFNLVLSSVAVLNNALYLVKVVGVIFCTHCRINNALC